MTRPQTQTSGRDIQSKSRLSQQCSPMALPDFEIFTSMRADMILAASELNAELSTTGQPSGFYMLGYHRDRMLAAAHAFDWSEAIATLDGSAGLRLLERKLFEHLELEYGDSNHGNPLKLRILLSSSGRLAATSTPTPELELASLFPSALPRRADAPAWRIFVSPLRTRATPHTSHKTTARDPYDAARALLPPSSAADLPAEILLVDADGVVMEGSITTPYFWRAGTWVTPTASRGGNIGTTRRWALERGLCVEGQVKRADLEMGEGVWLSNGVRGWGWGRIEVLAGRGQEESG